MKILVFDIGGTSIKYGCCIDHVLDECNETPTDAKLGGRHILDTVISLIKQESDYDAIGISTAGQVNHLTGSIIYANSNIPNYTGMEIKKELETLFHVPVSVENDVNSAALGEAIYGAGKSYENFLCLTYGTGVGGAIIQDKKVFHGSTYSAGEFGGIVVHGTQKLDGDDLFSGCYERYASTTALVRAASSFDSSLSNGRAVFENITNPEVKAIIDSWIDEILLGLTTIIHIFNPPCVILGGGIMAQPYIIDQITIKLNRFIMPSFTNVEIKPALLLNSAGLLGANYMASLLLEK